MIVEMEAPDGWRIAWAPLPGRQIGETCWPNRTITIDPRIPPAAKRCALTHEAIHVERGPSPAVIFDAREEAAVEQETARRLIGVRALGEALAESEDLLHAAATLDVTPNALTTRLAHLHPSERAFLRRRLEHREPEPEDPAGCCPAPGLACADCEYRHQCPAARADGPAAAG